MWVKDALAFRKFHESKTISAEIVDTSEVVSLFFPSQKISDFHGAKGMGRAKARNRSRPHRAWNR